MNIKNKIVLVFILAFIADMGSMVLLSTLKPGLENWETNPGFRLGGLPLVILAGIFIHATIIWYFYKPCFRSRSLNYEFCMLFVLVIIGHIFGTTANIQAYMAYVPTKVVGNVIIQGTPNPDSDTLNRATLSLGILGTGVWLLMYSPFWLYCLLNDEFKFEKIDHNKEWKKKYRWYYVLDESLKLAVNAVIYCLFGAFVSIYVDKYVHTEIFYSTKRLFELLFVLIAMYIWVNKIVRNKNANK